MVAAVHLNRLGQLRSIGPTRVADVHRGRERLSVARSQRQAGTSPWNVGRRCPLTMPRSRRTRHLIVDDFTLLVEDLRVRRSNRHACRRNPRLRDVGRSANLSRRNYGEGGSPTRRAVAAAKAGRLLVTPEPRAKAEAFARTRINRPNLFVHDLASACRASVAP